MKLLQCTGYSYLPTVRYCIKRDNVAYKSWLLNKSCSITVCCALKCLAPQSSTSTLLTCTVFILYAPCSTFTLVIIYWIMIFLIYGIRHTSFTKNFSLLWSQLVALLVLATICEQLIYPGQHLLLHCTHLSYLKC